LLFIGEGLIFTNCGLGDKMAFQYDPFNKPLGRILCRWRIHRIGSAKRSRSVKSNVISPDIVKGDGLEIRGKGISGYAYH